MHTNTTQDTLQAIHTLLQVLTKENDNSAILQKLDTFKDAMVTLNQNMVHIRNLVAPKITQPVVNIDDGKYLTLQWVRLKKLRKKLKYNQDEIADLYNKYIKGLPKNEDGTVYKEITSCTVSYFENGRNERSEDNTIKKKDLELMNALEVFMNTLEPNPNEAK